MTTSPPDPAALQARAAAAARFRDEFAAMRVVTHSPDHAVTVTTGPGGVTIGLELSDLALNFSATQLSATILQSLRAGTAEVARRTAALAEELLADNPAVLSLMRKHLPDLDGSTALQASGSGPRVAGWSSLTEEN